METGETLEQAVARETFEEAGVTLEPDRMILYTVTNLPSISEVYISFRAHVATEACTAGTESMEVRFVAEENVPWDRLAYAEMAGYLRMFFRELKAGESWIHLSRSDPSKRVRQGYQVVAREHHSRTHPTQS
jgi:8-oxo-dGTP pyrophosphatase MutT (NUDIX family)